MRLMRILIVLILCVKSLYRALPVQSKALENIDDQLFWQAAWFSEDTAPASPFTSDSKKITAKSIFITPNFLNKPEPYCPDGYRIDNGKCIKIIRLQQTSEEILATRLASLITTDDTTQFDYDYDSGEDDESNSNSNDKNQEEIKLPLVPILHESSEDTDSNSNINAKNITVKEPTTTFHDFRPSNKTDSVEVIITTLSHDDHADDVNGSHTAATYEHENANVSSTTIETTTTMDETKTTAEYESITEMNSNEDEASSVMQDRQHDDNQYVEPNAENSTKKIDIDITPSSTINDDDILLSNSTVLDYSENLQTDVTIIDDSDTINFDDPSFLLNDSLIMFNGSISGLTSDYDDVTTIDPFYEDKTTQQSNDVENITEHQLLIDEHRTSTLSSNDEDVETTSSDGSENDETNKFIYHHLPVIDVAVTTIPPPHEATATAVTATTEAVKGNKLKFPDEEINSRVRFPDDDYNHEISTASSRLLPATTAPTRFSWPRENGNNHRLTTNIFQFWNQQPLLNDFQTARENSKSFRVDNFFPYTRKVQIVTPQRYN